MTCCFTFAWFGPFIWREMKAPKVAELQKIRYGPAIVQGKLVSHMNESD